MGCRAGRGVGPHSAMLAKKEGVTAMERLQVILGTFTRLQAWGATSKGRSWLCYL